MELRHRSVVGSGGAILNCRHTPLHRDKPSVLIALPFGVPVGAADAPFMKLEPLVNVVTFESRYILNVDQTFSGDEPVAPADHVEDMLCILAALAIDTCSLVGYCSGAGISLLAATRHPDVFSELILVNGEYQLFRQPGHASTDYQRSIDTFLPVVAAGRQEAHFIFEKMSEITKVRKGDHQSELDRQINLPFSQEEYLFRYAKNYMGYRDFDALDIAVRVQQRTFVLTGGRDEHSSMENSTSIGEAIPDSRIFVEPTGDHYEFCRPGSSILAEISAHLAGAARLPGSNGSGKAAGV